jgi:hypothetical protein
MNENLLQQVWKYRLFNNNELKTTSGEVIHVMNPGEHNSDSGPDFFNARIRCGQTILAGNIEVHIRSSDWRKHFHQDDGAYSNIILHVVYDDDAPLVGKAGEMVLTVELKHRIPLRVLERYEDLQQLQTFVPCQQHWPDVDTFHRDQWLQRMLVERLETKCGEVSKLLEEKRNNWAETFYILLARNFGFKINAVPFEMMARQVPYHVFSKNKTDLLQTEAVLFGVAGFLGHSKLRGKYYNELRKEYRYQKLKHKLEEIDPALWKFLRLRPANFPQVRIAQFAALIHSAVDLFGKLIEETRVEHIGKLLECHASRFWDTHYTFEEASTERSKHLGADAIEILLINTVIPFLFLYGKVHLQSHLEERALNLFEITAPEENAIIRKWNGLGTGAKNAGQTQALLHLKKNYCDKRRCLECSVGLKILKQNDGVYRPIEQDH